MPCPECLRKLVLPNVQAGVYAIILTQTLDGFVQNAVLPSMPYYAMAKMNANAMDISLFGSAMCVAQMLLCPFLGQLSDRIGRKKVLLSALACQAFFNLYQSTACTVTQLVIARTLIGLAMSSGPVEMAYILDYVGDDDEALNPVLAIQKIAVSFGSLAGPFLASFFTPDEFPSLCYLLVGVNCVNFVIGWFFWIDYTPDEESEVEKEEKPRGESELSRPFLPTRSIPEEREASVVLADTAILCTANEEESPAPSTDWAFLNRTTLILLVISIMNSCAFQISDVNSAIYFKNYFGFTQKSQCRYMMVLQGSTLVWTILIPTLISKFGERLVCIWCALCSGAIVINLILLQGVWWVPYCNAFFLVGLFGTAIGFGYLNFLQKKLSRDYLGAFFGLSNSMQSVGGTAAPLIGGFLYDRSPVMPYYLTVSMYIVVAFLYACLDKKSEEEELSEEEDDIPKMRPARSSIMTRPMSMQTMQYATSTNLAVNLLSVDISMYAEAYASHQRRNWRERTSPGMMAACATAPSSLGSLTDGLSSMHRNNSGNSLRKPPKRRMFSVGDLQMPTSSSDGDLPKLGMTRRFSNPSVIHLQ